MAFLIWYNGFTQKKGIKLIDSLSRALSKAKADTNKVVLLNRLSFQCVYNDAPRGLIYGKQALQLAEQLNWQKGKATALLYIGDNYRLLNKFDSALLFCSNSLKLFEEIKDQDGMADANRDFGNIHVDLNNYPKALEAYQKSIILDKKSNRLRSMAKTLNCMGVVYFDLGKYAISLSYFNQALDINKKEVGQEREIANNLGNIALVYDHLLKFKDALEINFKCLDMYREIQDSLGIADTYGNMGNDYQNLFQFKNAIQYHQKARDIYYARGNSARMALDIASIGTIYLSMYKKDRKIANLDTSVSFLEEGISILRRFHDSTNTRDNLERLAQVDTLKGDYKKALAAFTEATTINDSIFSKKNIEKTAKLESKFENDKKELEKNIREQNEKAQETREHNIEKSIIALLIVLIFPSIIIARRKLKPVYIRTLTAITFFIFFEFLYLLIHGSIEKITESPIILLGVLVFAAGILGRVHHKIERWAVIQFTTVNSHLKSPNNLDHKSYQFLIDNPSGTDPFITLLNQFRQSENYTQIKSACDSSIERYRKAIDYPNFVNIDVTAFFSIKDLGVVVAPPIKFIDKHIQKFAQFLVMLFDEQTEIDIRFNEGISHDWKFTRINEGIISKLLLIHKKELYYYKTKKVNHILKVYGIEFPKSPSIGYQYRETCNYLKHACRESGIDNFAVLHFYLCQEWDRNYS